MKKTSDRGLGWRHRQAVEYLRGSHRDGSPCDWCGRPMWLDATKNYDYDPASPGKHANGVLQGDHSVKSRSESLRAGEPVLPPDRLLHGECNRMRGKGLNDDLAPIKRTASDLGLLSMPWPWAD